ncbi:hypothetical protein [Pararhizobium qamdonense]|uniref:hypothetical protein n=1 Tax=Pararhizobium qamdonense TaxID=3031126 RepID=UPI0023E1BE23|nr:hypothetical protein [Pararhizobium qamdonense]
MPQGGRYICCDRCKESTFSLNLPWNQDGRTKQAAREAGWKVEHDPSSNTGEDVCPTCLGPTIYDEFDDCVWHGSYCDSKKAHAAIMALVAEHNLGFLHNPGGGQFTRINDKGVRDFNCQITLCDEVLDLNTLRKALA